MLSLASEVHLALVSCESSDLALDFLPASLEEVEDASAHAVSQTPANRDQSLVLPGPAKCANHALSRVASGPSAPSRLGLRASSAWRAGACDAEKCRSERVRGHAVPYALGGLHGAKSYDVGEVYCDSCSVKSSAALGFAYPLSLALSFLVLPGQLKEAGQLGVMVGGVSGLANVGEAGVGGGSTTLSVSRLWVTV
ncbi:hypothetical protein B0H13DRAFT_2352560 [Mycena leptocephala]|nr:hypothetical protein B0H13DRAFT_2352560 [Mycena leptocephala]